jgi:hypothetical protein
MRGHGLCWALVGQFNFAIEAINPDASVCVGGAWPPTSTPLTLPPNHSNRSAKFNDVKSSHNDALVQRAQSTIRKSGCD